jgi:hypothetical protein
MKEKDKWEIRNESLLGLCGRREQEERAAKELGLNGTQNKMETRRRIDKRRHQSSVGIINYANCSLDRKRGQYAARRRIL